MKTGQRGARAGRQAKREPTTQRAAWSPAGHEEASPYHVSCKRLILWAVGLLDLFFQQMFYVVSSTDIFGSDVQSSHEANDITLLRTAPRAFEFPTSILNILECLARSDFDSFTTIFAKVLRYLASSRSCSDRRNCRLQKQEKS